MDFIIKFRSAPNVVLFLSIDYNKRSAEEIATDSPG